jgi:DNA polymerase-3 subunit alpha
MTDFVHLHLHTQYSLLDGAIRFDRLFNLAKTYNMNACAITDHGNMFGVVDFYFAARDAGIKPLLGCEAYLAPKSRMDRKVRGEENAYHIVLLAMNDQGYRNLMKIVSFANLEGFYYVPRADKELLRRYNEGLVCLTACLKGEIPSMILKGDEKATRGTVEEYMDLFGDRLFFELQDNGLPEQKIINEGLVDLSRHYGVPIVATNDCHYLKREESVAHELLLCIQTGKTMNDQNRLSFSSNEFYFKSADDMARAFSQYPEALKNTMRVAEMCNLTLDVGTYHFPEFTPPRQEDPTTYFENLCREGFQWRLTRIRATHDNFTPETEDVYRKRLDYELDVIKKTGFVSYFLIVSDFINYAKKEGIPVGPGRGSAAGSLVAYCLGITDIDPIKYDLLFERFLNPARISMPDIDIDFCMAGRERVIQYVTEKYGKDNVAQIITFGTMQSKAAIRDVGRALGMPYADVDRIAKLLSGSVPSLEKAVVDEPQLRDLYNTDQQAKTLLDNAMVLEGLARHASTHAAGIVISNKHLAEHLPLYRGKKGETLTQYPMKVIEKIGLVKIDFLGLQTLTVIDHVVKLLKSSGVDIDLVNLPLDDGPTYTLLSSGNTSGIFQLESEGMRDLLVKLKPSKFEDIIALIALHRPGPMNSGMMDEFIKRKNNPALVKYETEQLKDVLADTYGVIVYQEQVMHIASLLAGFPLKDADALRKAMSKKIPEELQKYRERFVSGSIEKGVKPDVAEKIYDVIVRFGEYGFNKSHSTAYAVLAYQTAYLKAHHPVPFMAAILTSEVNNADKMIRYITECRDAGIEILPPDVNTSEKAFAVVVDKIRFGLSGVKNVGDAAIDSLIEARERLGEFTSFYQFLSEMDTKKANKKVIEALIKAGCFDAFGLKRSQLFHVLNERSEKSQKKEGHGYQMDIFGSTMATPDRPTVPDMEELPYDEILKGEKEALGFFFSEHPLKAYDGLIRRITAFDTQNVKECGSADEVDLAGVIGSCREVTTKRGDKMAYVALEDTKGIVDVIVFPELYGQTRNLIKGDSPLLVTGSVEATEDGGAKVKAKRIRLLEEATRDVAKSVTIRIYCDRFTKDELRKLRDVLLGIKGKSRVVLLFVLNGEQETLPLEDLTIDHTRVEILAKHFADRIDYEVADEVLFRF